MNSRHLKWIAIITMVIDHVGHFLFPELFFLRVIGRLAFPIFTFLFALSARYTHNRIQLGLRVWLSAIFGQMIMIAFGAGEIISILFLFGLALIMFELIDRNQHWTLFIFAFIAEYFHVDYGAYGILVLYFFYVNHAHFKKQAISYSSITLLFVLIPFFESEIFNVIPTIIANFFSVGWKFFVQAFSIVSLLFLSKYDSQKPKVLPKPFNNIEKYFYYFFYPLHLAFLAWLGA